MKAICVALAIWILAGAAFALDFNGSATNTLQYHGGVTEPVATGGSVITTNAMITHDVLYDVSINQNGRPTTTFVSGPADVTIRVRTSATMGYALSASDSNPSRTGAVENAAITPMFDDTEYNFLRTRYPTCIKIAGLNSPYEGLHAINFKSRGSYVLPGTCMHTFQDPTAISIHYNPTGLPADANPAGMGNGYLYCNGSVRVNGVNVGKITDNDQTFSARITLVDGQTAVPVSAVYQCYFVSELYDVDGSKQSGPSSVENVNHQMPGGLPLNQTVNVDIPRVNPPVINLVPLILLNLTYYTSGTPTITVDAPNTRFDISFFVNRTDNLTEIKVPRLNWSLGSGIPTLIPITGTYRNFILVPELEIGTPTQLPDPRIPTVITVCRPGVEFDEVLLVVNLDNSIPEYSYSDNSIRLIFDCSGIYQLQCRFDPGSLATYPGQTKMANMTCYEELSGEPMDCPEAETSDVRYGNGLTDFLDHYLPLTDDSLDYDSGGNATNLVYVTAKGSIDPDAQPYSDTITVKFPPDEGDFECSFGLDWRLPDCRYYM
jgi:hypothetical protein